MTVYVPGIHEMETSSGRYVDLDDLSAAPITLDDVASHLSRIGRYTGAASRFLSVGEHALLVADRLRAQGYGPATILLGLHHDDGEAYVGDVARPLKLKLGEVYRRIEEEVYEAVHAALDLPHWTGADLDVIKAADDWALAAEAYHLLPSRGEGWATWGLYSPDDPRNPPSTSRLYAGLPLEPGVAAALFVDAHLRLTDQLDR